MASPEVLQAGDVVAGIQFLGKINSNSYSVLGTIRSFYRNDGGTNIGGELNFGTNGISRMVISPNGNVGINKPNPTAKLHVVKTSAELTPAIIEGCNVYSSNTDAVSAGLPVGALYRTATGQLMVRY